MLTLFDTHAHFPNDFGAPSDDFPAFELKFMAVGGSPELNESAVAAPTPYKALGYDRDQVDAPRAPIDYAGVDAVGEIGLDYHYSPGTRTRQIALFEEQLQLAADLDKPVVIHTREADEDTLGCLKNIRARGIIHSFTGGPAFCRALLDLGFMISYSGIVTFRAADNVRETARFVPDDRILVETDSPYLAPVPLRGRPNRPEYVYHVAKFLAGLRGTNLDDFAALTVRNALSTLCSSPS